MKGEPEVFVFLRRFSSRFTFCQYVFKLLALTVFFSFITILKSESNPSPKTIRLVTPSNTVDTVISEVVLREAYQRLGYKVELTKFPAERSLILADKGIFDGEVQRIDGLSKNYPNLIQVFPATNFVEGSVFTLIENLKIERWENLRPYEVGIIRGIKFAEKSTDGMRRHVVGEYETLFVMLQNKRFDLVVSPRLNGIYQLKLMAMTSVYEIAPPLEQFKLFHYLHKSRSALVPRIEAVLLDMFNKGELEQIRKRVIKVLLSRAEKGLSVCDDNYQCFEPLFNGG